MDQIDQTVQSLMNQFSREGWRTVRFDQMAQSVNERVDDPSEAGVEYYVGLEHLDPESLKIRRWGVPTDVEATKLRFKPGDIIFGRRRAYQRKVAVADFEGICSAHALVLRARAETCLPEFLPFFMQSETFFERAMSISVGSLSPTINWKTLAQQEFVLPPLDEQRRIAEILWAADDVGAATLCVLKSTQAASRMYLRAVIENTIYPKIKVGKVSRFTSGKSIRVSELAGYSEDTPIPVYGGNGISGYTHLPLAEAIDRVVVIGRVGQYCGAVQVTTGPSWVTDNALLSISLKPEIDVDYLGLVLEATNINSQKIGNYLPLINQKVVHSIEIPYPPYQQQRDIVMNHEFIRKGIASTQKHLVTSKNLAQELREILLRPKS